MDQVVFNYNSSINLIKADDACEFINFCKTTLFASSPQAIAVEQLIDDICTDCCNTLDTLVNKIIEVGCSS